MVNWAAGGTGLNIVGIDATTWFLDPLSFLCRDDHICGNFGVSGSQQVHILPGQSVGGGIYDGLVDADPGSWNTSAIGLFASGIPGYTVDATPVLYPSCDVLLPFYADNAPGAQCGVTISSDAGLGNATVPEPNTSGLVAIGLALIAVVRRRGRNARN